MHNTISFMSANYVARRLGYNMTHGWGEGDRATNEHFRPLETFPERLEEILEDVKALAFKAMDVWTAHLNPAWATEEHVAAARDLLAKYELTLPSLAGWFGSTPTEFEASCKLARALGIQILGGSTSLLKRDYAFVVRTLKKYDLKLGVENHPEKNPEEMLEQIGNGGEGVIGTTVDTGWYGTQGYDAAAAIEALADQLVHVHLKDVLSVDEHHTCRYGQGIVPVEACVKTLQRIGYRGAISLEHEPETFDPTEDCRISFEMLKEWVVKYA